MGFVERRGVYFQTSGKENTETVLKLAREYAKAEGISDVVVASTTGETGAKASEIFRGFNLVVVTHHFGFREPGEHELTGENRKRILENGGKILTGTHALASVERAIRKKFGTLPPLELIANTLRRFGEGTKVCVEIVLMAADAGLIPVDRDVVAIAGTGRGADTALIVKPANSSMFFDFEVREVIAKPRSRRKAENPSSR